MPRKRPKTAADRPTYRRPALPPLAVPDDLEPFLAGIELRRIIEKYGAVNIQLILGVLAEQARRELIDRRRSEMLDAWKANLRPMAAATPPKLPSLQASDARRRAGRYRRHREEVVDSTIQQQARVRQLEDGLAIIRESGADAWYCRQVAEIVDRTEAGQSVAQMAHELGISTRTVERRLAEIRNVAVVAAEKEQLSSPSPLPGQNGGLGPQTLLDL